MKQFNLISIMVASAIIIFTSGCKKDEDPDPYQVAYDAASSTKGGIMYNNFWSTEAEFDQSNSHLATFNAKADFFRCKQCHGWDLLGTSGSYIGRAANANRPAVAGLNLFQDVQSKTYKELFDAMKKTTDRRDVSYDLTTYDPATNATVGNQMPNLTQFLTDAQIWDIVKFLKEGAFDVSQLYNATYTGTYPTGTVAFSNIGLDGDAASGNTYFASKCAGCHGDDGTDIDLGGKTVGKFLRTSPHEVQHKVKYGQLGSTMTGKFDITVAEMKNLYKALADTVAYPN